MTDRKSVRLVSGVEARGRCAGAMRRFKTTRPDQGRFTGFGMAASTISKAGAAKGRTGHFRCTLAAIYCTGTIPATESANKLHG